VLDASDKGAGALVAVVAAGKCFRAMASFLGAVATAATLPLD